MSANKLFDHDQEAYLEALLATLPGIVVIMGPDFRILDMNAQGLAMIGVCDVNEIHASEPLAVISQADLPRFKSNLEQAFNSKHIGPLPPFLIAITPATGGEQVHECRVAPLRGPHDKIVAAVISCRDVTVLENAVAMADRATSVLQSIIDTVPDAMIVIDNAGRIKSLSKAAVAMLGYSEAELLGENVNMLMPPEFRMHHDRYIENYLKSGEKRIIGKGRDVEAQRKDGSIFPMHVTVGEAIVGEEHLFTGFIHDLSQRRRTEAQLQKMQSNLLHASRLSAVGTMVSALAHELNQPLTAVANYLSASRDMLCDATLAPASCQTEMHQALEQATSECLRAGRIVHRLRDFVASGELDIQILSMAELVEHATTLGLVDARAMGVEYTFDIQPDINHVLADPVQIQQVMINLMRNAVEAMADSPLKKLVVTAHSVSDDRVEFVVQDTGPGFAAEIADRLFESFATTKTDGMGIGLSICKTIIDAHGGELVADTAPGGGAIFRFTLPKAKKAYDDEQ